MIERFNCIITMQVQFKIYSRMKKSTEQMEVLLTDHFLTLKFFSFLKPFYLYVFAVLSYLTFIYVYTDNS